MNQQPPTCADDARLPLNELPTEHLRGSIPADPALAAADLRVFYDGLRAASRTPLLCQPDQAIHVYAADGPCQCATNPQGTLKEYP